MQTFLALLGVVAAVGLLWTGLKRIETESHWKAALSILDIAVLGASVVLLGWIGVAFVLAANVLAVLINSVRLAMKKEERLVYASTQCGATKEQLEELDKEFRRDPAEPNPFALMGPITRADLISRLAQRGRSVDEMRQMARPVALLWATHRPDLDWLVDRFDQLLRLDDMTPEDSMDLADVLSGATKTSAATFEETVDGLVAASDGRA